MQDASNTSRNEAQAADKDSKKDDHPVDTINQPAAVDNTVSSSIHEVQIIEAESKAVSPSLPKAEPAAADVVIKNPEKNEVVYENTSVLTSQMQSNLESKDGEKVSDTTTVHKVSYIP